MWHRYGSGLALRPQSGAGAAAGTMRPTGNRPRPGRDGRQPDVPVSLQKSRTHVTLYRL